MNGQSSSLSRLRFWSLGAALVACVSIAALGMMGVVALTFAIKGIGAVVATESILLAVVELYVGGQNFIWRPPDVQSSPTQVRDVIVNKERAGMLHKIRYARDLLPPLGFLGTLLGLSFAMMQIALTDPVKQILEKPGISPELTFSLGMAFNTTFVALLLSATLTLYLSYLAGASQYARQLLDRLEAGK